MACDAFRFCLAFPPSLSQKNWQFRKVNINYFFPANEIFSLKPCLVMIFLFSVFFFLIIFNDDNVNQLNFFFSSEQKCKRFYRLEKKLTFNDLKQNGRHKNKQCTKELTFFFYYFFFHSYTIIL